MKDLLVNHNIIDGDHEKFLVLIIYDIVDNRRRYAFCKYISSYAIRVQKSCFETFLTKKQFAEMSSKIDYYINNNEDNVRIYRLSGYGKVHNYGSTIEEFYQDNIIL